MPLGWRSMRNYLVYDIYNTRTCDRIHLDNIHTNKGLCNPISQASTVYNNLPVNIKNSRNESRFIKQLKLYCNGR